MESNSPIQSTKDISRVFISEMVDRIITNAQSILNAVYDGSIPEDTIFKIRKFDERMRLSCNAVQLKRNIAEFVFEQEKYPY